MEPKGERRLSFGEWARDRAPLLAAVGVLFLAVAILIVFEITTGH